MKFVRGISSLLSSNDSELRMAASDVRTLLSRDPSSVSLEAAHYAAFCELDIAGRELVREPGAEFRQRLALGMQVVRFVNAFTGVDETSSSIRDRAMTIGIPAAVVSARHSAAHEVDMPTLGMLEDVARLSMEWLRTPLNDALARPPETQRAVCLSRPDQYPS